jgi:hypothetical protein
MATILDRKYTAADSPQDLIQAIIVLATDKNERLLISDEE